MKSSQLQNTGIEKQSHETDVVVVGGGLAGLATAALIARTGRKVTLFEKSAHTGGRAASTDSNGFILNLGAHALYKKSLALETLNQLGVKFTTGSPEGIRCMSGGKTYPAPVDTATLMKTHLLNLPAKLEAARLLVKLQFAEPADYAKVTLAEWLEYNVRNVSVRRFMEMSARTLTYSNAPHHLSMSAIVEQLRLAVKGKGKVLYVDSGWQTIVDGLEKAARQAGAQLVTGVAVTSVEHDSGQVKGIRLSDGTYHQARAVVIAAGPKDVLKLVGDAEIGSLRDFAESAVPVQAACMDITLKRLPNPQNKVVMALDRPLFLAAQSEFSKVAPDGGAVIYTLKYLDPTQAQDAKADERELEAWLDETQHGWRNEIIERRYLPHMIVSNALPSASQAGTVGRPGPCVPDISNLYIAGDWVGATGNLANVSLGSAKLASDAILRGLNVGAASEAA